MCMSSLVPIMAEIDVAAQKKCLQCGNMNPKGAASCLACGRPLPPWIATMRSSSPSVSELVFAISGITLVVHNDGYLAILTK